MKTLLIGLPNTGSRPGRAGLFLPLGLAYISAALKEAGYEYATVDFHTQAVLHPENSDYWAVLQEDFDLASFDVVAFGGVFLNIRVLIDLSQKLYRHHPDILQVVGGNMATLSAELILNSAKVRLVCLYEEL